MNKLAVIAAFLALSSCATFSGDPESPEESPDQSPPLESAPSTEPEAGAETTAPDVPEAPLPEAPAPELDAPGLVGPAEELSGPETPLGRLSPRATSARRPLDEVALLPAPSLPPASDSLSPTTRPGAAGTDTPQATSPGAPSTGFTLPEAQLAQPGPTTAPDPEPAPQPDPEPAAASEPEPRLEPQPEPAPQSAQGDATPARRAPAPVPAPEPERAQPEREPEPERRSEPQPPQRDDAAATARQPAPPVSETRRVAVGNEMRLSLGDGGWVYLGEESGEDGLSFRRRYSEDGDTVFVFSVEEPGDYVVRFQRQDLDRGVFREERMAVEARPEPGAGGARVADATGGDGTEGGDGAEGAAPGGDTERAASVDLDEAYALLNEGRREAALDAFLQSYPVGNPDVHALIARLAYELGRWETARSHWSRNLDADEPFSRNARLGLFRTALKTEDAESAWDLYGQLEEEGPAAPVPPAEVVPPAAPVPPAEAEVAPPAEITDDELLQLGNLLLDSSDPSRAVVPLEAYMDAGGTPNDPAELYYRIGRLHEDRRDARAAMEYYRRVVEGFPLSRHWQPAQERIQYLRRHFFDIR